MRENGNGASPSELVNRVEERREERIAGNIVDACWKLLRDGSGERFTSVPGWACEIPGCDWVDAGIIAIVFRDDRKDPGHEFYKSYSSFAKDLKLSKMSICRHMEKLVEMGVVSKSKRKGARGAFTWHLNAPKIIEFLGWLDKR